MVALLLVHDEERGEFAFPDFLHFLYFVESSTSTNLSKHHAIE